MNPFSQFVRNVSERLGAGFSSINKDNFTKAAYVRNLEREVKAKEVMDQPLKELTVTVFDLETTGFYPYNGDRILSIGAVRVHEGTIESPSFYTLVQSERVPSNEISELTGITEAMLADAPTPAEALKDFFQFVGGDPLVAHHAKHEKEFMSHATWQVLRKSFRHRMIDTMPLAQMIHPMKSLSTLDECCDLYGINHEERHHALSDAMATAELWQRCVRDLSNQGIETLRDVYVRLATM